MMKPCHHSVHSVFSVVNFLLRSLLFKFPAVFFTLMVVFPSSARAESPFDQAEALWAEGELDQAIWEYKKVVSATSLPDEDRVYGLFRLGMARMGAGRESEALDAFREVEERYPGHSLAPFALLFQANYALLERSQLRRGVDMYGELIRRYPKSEAARKASEWLPELRKMNQSRLRAYNIKRKRREAEAERQAEREERRAHKREEEP